MDDIFEQMLSNPSWGDTSGSMAMDSIGTLQRMDSIHRIQPTPGMGGVMDNQRSSLYITSQEELDINFKNELGIIRPPSKPQSSTSWKEPIVDSMPPLPSSIGVFANSSAFPFPNDAILHNVNLGKRTREGEDAMKALDMIHGMIPSPTHSDQALFGKNGTASAANGAGRPRVRARRGQATDPHSIAERKRRERITERMKALQELVPDSNKTDKASMLDEIIGYVKFLQMQVKCLSMCRLGGAGATAPLLADLPAEGGANFITATLAQGNVGMSHDGLAFAERQVAQLMDEDMSAAMQYLQSKGLCLMPISLATSISNTSARYSSKSLDGSGHEQVGLDMQATVGSCVGNPANQSMGIQLVSHGVNDKSESLVTAKLSNKEMVDDDPSESESDDEN